MKLRTKLLAAAFVFAMASPASALIVSVTGPVSTAGTAPAIIGNPSDVNDDAATNTGMQGFNEQQGFTLGAALDVDAPFDIPAGTIVDSHMIFLNSAGNTRIDHLGVEWEFDGVILGTMSNGNGSLEVASSGFLGATGTTYPLAAFTARGLESNDSISFAGNLLTLSMIVTEPGDWIRVITQGTPGTVGAVPLPAALPLYGTGLAIMGFIGWRRKRKVTA